MITLKNKQEIILRHYREGDSIRKISRDLGLNRKTVSKYLKAYESRQKQLNSASVATKSEIIDDIITVPNYHCENRVKRKLNVAIISDVKQYLAQNQQKRLQGQRKQQLKKIDIYELLQEKGYDIGYTTICNLINSLESQVPEVFIRQQYQAGDVCEFDWGEVKIDIGKGIEKLQLAVFTSAYGNYRYARLFKQQDTHSFQQAHACFFKKINGVYKTLVYDNMRVAIKKFVGAHEKEATDGLLKLSLYYNFSFRFCNIRRGNEKGHVERSVEYVRRKTFARKVSFRHLAAANEYLEQKCDSLNKKVQVERDNHTAEMLLKEEQAALFPIKPMFECSQQYGLKVDKYSTISYKTCRYSVPEQYVGRIVMTKVYPGKIICFDDNRQKTCSHTRLYGLHEWSINIEHYTETLKKKPGAIKGSVALAQIDSRLNRIYQKYYLDRERDLIDLIEYMRDSAISIEKIELAIAQLQPVKDADITIDKLKLLCTRKTEANDFPQHGEDEIDKNCYVQLKALTQLIPDSHNLEMEKTEVK